MIYVQVAMFFFVCAKFTHGIGWWDILQETSLFGGK